MDTFGHEVGADDLGLEPLCNINPLASIRNVSLCNLLPILGWSRHAEFLDLDLFRLLLGFCLQLLEWSRETCCCLAIHCWVVMLRHHVCLVDNSVIFSHEKVDAGAFRPMASPYNLLWQSLLLL